VSHAADITGVAVTAALRSVGEGAAYVVSDLSFRAIVQQIRERGLRVLGEFLAYIAAERSPRTYIEKVSQHFLPLDDDTIEMLGADRMPPAPLSLVVDNEIEGGESADDDDAGRHVLDSDGSAD
jgi:hypothetical protein